MGWYKRRSGRNRIYLVRGQQPVKTSFAFFFIDFSILIQENGFLSSGCISGVK